ncbi:MAG: SRPBCC family protein [Deltaproteobacteria bacterium]|nr:SRPBCC family protein [Deltaproteobacteria bacterium]
MREYRLHRSLFLNKKIEEVFAFFADPFNLSKITPPWLQFKVLSKPEDVKMEKGFLINYQIKLRGMPIRWQSEITLWDPPHVFVDEQRKGPYRLWRHYHRFEPKAGGTEVIDEVLYAHFGGRLVNRLWVAKDLKKIFDYRHEKLRELVLTM